MKVSKRNGTVLDFNIDKIKQVISWASKGLDVNPLELESKVSLALTDGVSTRAIQENLINQAVSLTSIHSPDWRYVAGRLLIMNLWKEVRLSRKLPKDATFDRIVDYQIKKGRYSNQIYHFYSRQDLKNISNWIDDTFDLDYDYAGASLLQRRYLVDEEMPQECFLMISLLLASVEREENRMFYARSFFEALRQRKISLATPLLMNLRRPNGNLSSCFIIAMDDSWDSISKTIMDIGNISKNAGGVGVNISRIRALGSTVNGSKGASGGVVPWIRLINDTAVAVNQQGKRSGAVTVSLDSWHLDIEEFLELQTENGDQRRKAYDIFPQIVVSDIFMERAEKGEDWILFDPYEIRSKYCVELCELWEKEFTETYKALEEEVSKGNIELYKKVNAKELMKRVMRSQLETGMPYVTFKDTVNRFNPNKDDGYIPGTNLCVAPETKILTSNGYFPIIDLVGQKVDVWNGQEFSTTTIKKTGNNQKLIRVNLSNAESIDCTDYHHFYTQNGFSRSPVVKVEAKNLKAGDKLIKYNLPVIEGVEEFPYAYTHGFFCGDGTYERNGMPSIYLYDEKKSLLPLINIRKKLVGVRSGGFRERSEDAVYTKENSSRIQCKLPLDISEKFTVPSAKHTIESRLAWFSGLLDSDGCVASNTFQIGSVNKDFLLDVRLMLQTLGVDSKVTKAKPEGRSLLPNGKGGKKYYPTQESFRLLVSSYGVYHLSVLGLKTNRLKWKATKPNRNATEFIRVVSVEDLGRVDDTYCFTEPKRNMGMFNGVLTGQCVESYSNVKPHELAHCCNLVSLNLANIQTEYELDIYSRLSVRILDNAIDLTSPPIDEAGMHNQRYRTIGVGSMGLADWLAKREISYSKSAEKVEKLFEDIAYYTFAESVGLAKDRGTFDAYNNSEFKKGKILCHELGWFLENSYEPNRWKDLFIDLEKYGIRNSQIQAIAPNTSSSLLQGCTASVLPVYNKFYLDKSSSGTIPIAPPYIKEKFWFYPEFKNIDPQTVIDITSKIQKWTDTGISMELLFNLNNPKITAKYIFETIIHAWKQGCKAIYYIRSIQKDESDVERVEGCSTCVN